MALVVPLVSLLLIVAALVLWQHSRRGTPAEITYGVEDSVAYIYERLVSDVAQRLGRAGVRRIVEWEVFYLQGLAQPDRRQPVVSVAGDYPPAVDFIMGEIARRHGLTYSVEDISAVLELEASYLESIGAIGEEAGGFEE